MKQRIIRKIMSKKDPWKTFFSKEMGHAMFDPISPASTVREVEQILRAAKPRPGASILDLGCGIGRHSLEFAERGFDVVGLDFSKDYLAQANQTKKQKKLVNVQFVQGDMRKVDRYFPPASFGLVICVRDTFGYFDERKDDKRVLASVARILEPKGAFVLNVSNKSGIEYHWQEQAVRFGYPDLLYWREYKSGSFHMERFIYNSRSARASMECIVVEPGKRSVKRCSLQKNIYSHQWFVATLKVLGLKVESRWERLGTRRKFHDRGWQQSFVARKGALRER
jgi:ubiquinone/menaquinone biosynthesis C-methylase UbiE